MHISDFRQRLDNLKGRRDQVKESLLEVHEDVGTLGVELLEYEEAQRRIQLVARQTQQQLEYQVSTPVTTALGGVFDNPYGFEIRFVERRGQTEADLIFSRGGVEYKDLSFSGGGGAVDVAAWGLQIAAWAMGTTRPFLLCDEPLKFLKSKNKVLEQRGAMMINEVSHELGLQILMISHIPEQQKGSDRGFNLRLDKAERTQVEVV